MYAYSHVLFFQEEYILKVILNTKISVFLLRGNDIPTVHLSIPDKMYQELRTVASSMGIQITDLIKMFIKKGLHGDLTPVNVPVGKLKDYEDEITYLKGKLFILETLLNELLAKNEELERRIRELESPDIILRSRRFGSGRINKP